MQDPSNTVQVGQVEFCGFGRSANGDITLSFLNRGQNMSFSVADPNAQSKGMTAIGLRRADAANPLELGTDIPGELIQYQVKPGDVLKTGQPLCILESMKMEVKISVPEHMDGFVVGSLPAKGRTAELQGDVLKPGDLLLESTN